MRKKWLSRCMGVVLSVSMLLIASAAPAIAVNYNNVNLNDGTYTGTAKGFGGDIVATVTVSGGKITAIDAVGAKETPEIYETAQPIVNTIIEKQSTDIDTISGATLSSQGILNAVDNALATGTHQSVTLTAASWSELLSALAKAQDGDTVKIVQDIKDAGTVSQTNEAGAVDVVASATATVNKRITVDGGKHIITPGSLDGEKAAYAFLVNDAEGIEIRDLTIQEGSHSSDMGGAMYVKLKTGLTLNNVSFINCSAGKDSPRNCGGAIYAENNIKNNERTGTPTVVANNCTFTGNTVTSVASKSLIGRGGAVAGLDADITLNNCTFSGNKAAYGGAVTLLGEEGKLKVNNCTFDNSNDSTYGGDDIYLFDGYTWQKAKEQRDSSIAATLSGNTFSEDGANFTDYRVVRASVLGIVTDTVNSVTAMSYGDDYSFTGWSDAANDDVLLCGHSLRFASNDANRTGTPLDVTELKKAQLAARATDGLCLKSTYQAAAAGLATAQEHVDAQTATQAELDAAVKAFTGSYSDKHTYKKTTVAATTSKTGKITYTCSVCGHTYSEVIPKLTQKKNAITVKTSVTKTSAAKVQSFSLNAKATGGTLTYKPSVKTVKVSKAGKVTFPKNFVGKVVITVTAGSDTYKTVSKKVTVTVKPQGTKLSSIAKAKGLRLTIKWKKNSAVTGYQVQYSKDKTFKKSAKTLTVKKNKTVKVTTPKLAKKTKYYVRIRTYKTVSERKYYSSWSKMLNATTAKK